MATLPTTPAGKLGLAAVVLLAPGGFILGAGLAVQLWRKRGAPGG